MILKGQYGVNYVINAKNNEMSTDPESIIVIGETDIGLKSEMQTLFFKWNNLENLHV